jgi:hypothetical protein
LPIESEHSSKDSERSLGVDQEGHRSEVFGRLNAAVPGIRTIRTGNQTTETGMVSLAGYSPGDEPNTFTVERDRHALIRQANPVFRR